MSAGDVCLHCGETRGAVKREHLICGTVDYFGELSEEYGNHRWADWKDNELAYARIKPEAYERHRRSSTFDLQWAGCDDTTRGHQLATSSADTEWSGARIGQCTQCGHTPETETP